MRPEIGDYVISSGYGEGTVILINGGWTGKELEDKTIHPIYLIETHEEKRFWLYSVTLLHKKTCPKISKYATREEIRFYCDCLTPGLVYERLKGK
jgi:hypothetical protein